MGNNSDNKKKIVIIKLFKIKSIYEVVLNRLSVLEQLASS